MKEIVEYMERKSSDAATEAGMTKHKISYGKEQKRGEKRSGDIILF
jgi:hypothetical protein